MSLNEWLAIGMLVCFFGLLMLGVPVGITLAASGFVFGFMGFGESLFALLPAVADAVRLPVVATGGIADARGVAAAIALGASAVQVGTAYLLCPEADTSPLHRAALRAARDAPAEHPTALTNLFTGRPARGLVNRLMRELGPMREAARGPSPCAG